MLRFDWKFARLIAPVVATIYIILTRLEDTPDNTPGMHWFVM